MVLACPSSLVCMLHTTIFEGRPPRWCPISKKKWLAGPQCTNLQLKMAGFVPHGFVVLGSRFGNNGWQLEAGAQKNSRRLVPPGWLTLAHQGWPMHPCCPGLAMPIAPATQIPPGPGGSPASTRCRRHRCSRPRATAWAQRGAKVSHLGGRGCAPEVWAPAVATQRVHWHPTPQAWQNGRFAGAPWCPNGAVSCANSPRRPQKFHGPRHKPPGWQRKPQEGPRPRRGRPCGGTGPPPSSAVLAQGPTHHAAPNGIGPPWCCT